MSSTMSTATPDQLGPQDPVSGPVPPRERANTLCELARWADAATAAQEAIAEQPRDVQAWCLSARAQLGLDRARAGLQAARTASSLDPRAEEPHRLISLALGALGLDTEAADAATEATRCAPSSWQAHAQLARCLAALRDRLPDARRAAERARVLAPGQSGPHLAIGVVALASGRAHDATSAFCAALGVDPQCFEAHSQLALIGAAGSKRSAFPRLGSMLRRHRR